jgi:flagellin
MSGIILSSSVRQNLLSLQSTADLLSQTQNRLSTGKKVNSALDNPTNFFTASGLDSRASDINNLLDGIGNGVQILQAANTGITSLQKLVDTAKSIANQALQTVAGYTTKSNVTATIAGATSDDLRGASTFSSANALSNVLFSGAAGGTTAAASTLTLGGTAGTVAAQVLTTTVAQDATAAAGAVLHIGTTGGTAAGTTLISALTNGSAATATGPAAGDSITVDGKTITFTTAGAAAADANGNYTIGIDQSVNSLLSTIDTVHGNTVPADKSVVNAGGSIVLHSGVSSALTISEGSGGAVLAKLGLTATTVAVGSTSTGGAAISSSTTLFGPGSALSTSSIADGTTLSVNGKTITFKASATPTAASLSSGQGVLGNVVTDGSGNSTIYIGASSTATSATVGDLLNAVDLASGVKSATVSAGVATFNLNAGQTASSVTAGGQVTIESSTGGDLSLSGKADILKSLGLTASSGGASVTVSATRTTSSGSLGSLIQDGSTLTVDGKTITFKNAPAPASSASHPLVNGSIESDGNGNSTVYLQSATIADVLNAVDLATGVQTIKTNSTPTSNAVLNTATGDANSSILSGALKLSTGTVADLAITGSGNVLSALGLTGATGTNTSFSASRTASPGSVDGKTLTFTSFNGGVTTSITFGDGTNGTVKSLSDLNTALAANNLTASIDTTGKLTISASNDFASSTLGSVASGGAIGGTLTTALTFTTASAPVADPVAQTTRANLVSQYNNILDQINTTAQDASFNGVNLLNGDKLKLVFNETGKSTLSIQGVTFGATGLGLSNLTAGTDFIDNSATNKVLSTLTTAATSLRSEASALGSNLSIVQIRQDFSKNLINVLQTGSSNLTLADTNEEAANSQALSTRQSIAVSALSLANTSQQSVLQLLR